MTSLRGTRAGLVAVLLLGLLAGCAGTPSVLHYEFADTDRRWPGEPEVPRYGLVGQLTGEANFPASAAGVGTRFLRWVVGLTSPKTTPLVLQRPQSGFVDAGGRIYVTDVSHAAVFVFDEPEGEMRVWRAAGQSARFMTPVDVAPGADGEILVADADLGMIVRLNAQGEPLGGIGLGHLERPVGVVRDPHGARIFVADAKAHDVKVFSDGGELIGRFGTHGEGRGEFNAPTYVAWSGGELFVTDTLNSRVQVFDGQGAFVREFGRRGLFIGDLPRPKGVTVDHHGNVYVVESYYDHLLVFDRNGELRLAIGGSGSGVGQFFLPVGVWTDHRDRIYVADAFNGRVMIFRYLGEA